MLIFASPFIDRGQFGPVVEAIALTLVLLSGAAAVSGRRPLFLLCAALSVTAIAARWLEHFQASFVPPALLPTMCMLFVSLVIVELTRYILLAPRVDHEVVCAAIAGFVALGFVWSFAYILVSRMQAKAFAFNGQPVEALAPYDISYFSFMTLTGVAYGDITPATQVTRMLAVLEGLAGTFYMVILIGRLVSLYSSRRAAVTT